MWLYIICSRLVGPFFTKASIYAFAEAGCNSVRKHRQKDLEVEGPWEPAAGRQAGRKAVPRERAKVNQERVGGFLLVGSILRSWSQFPGLMGEQAQTVPLVWPALYQLSPP